MLKKNDAALIFIDVQGRLHEIMHEKDLLDANLEKLIRCATLLDLPIVGTEQIPEKLGPTSEPFKTLLEKVPMIGKTAFSCCGEPRFAEAFQALERRQAILAGPPSTCSKTALRCLWRPMPSHRGCRRTRSWRCGPCAMPGQKSYRPKPSCSRCCAMPPTRVSRCFSD